MIKYQHEMIGLSCIDFQDNFFHITRPPADGLGGSISEMGILKESVVEKKSGSFRIVSGFNRLSIARELGIPAAPVNIVEHVDSELFISLLISRVMSGRLGPVGKQRAIVILKNYCNLPDADEKIGRKAFGIPSEFLGESECAHNLVSLPAALAAYIDARDPGYRCLKTLLALPAYAIEYLERIAGVIPLRINIFRSIIDILADLAARDGELPVFKISAEEPDRRKLEEEFYSILYRTRYPEYSILRERADAIIGKITRRGVSVDFPESFEGGSYRLLVEIRSTDNAAAIRKRLESIDTEECGKLAALL